jgi:predicted ester cyclase
MAQTTQDRNKAQFRKLIDEAINGGKLDVADSLLTADRPDYQEFGGVPPGALAGYSGFKMIVGKIREAFPDLKFTSEYMIAEGDKVLSYNRIEGTHRAEFFGIPPTGRKFMIHGADVCSFDGDGKITAHWGVMDQFSMMVQLGVIPPPGASKR